MSRCPICGAHVRYAGLTTVECRGEFALDKHTKHCPNFFGAARAAEPDAPKPHSRRWARIVAVGYPGTKFTATMPCMCGCGTTQSGELDPWCNVGGGAHWEVV